MIALLSSVAWYVAMVLLIIFVLLVCLVLIAKVFAKRRRCGDREKDGSRTVGFFHPYCNAGGGGERVLWWAIRALQNEHPNVECCIYTGDKAEPDEILEYARKTFNISLPRKVRFIFLKKREWVEACYYPYFTLFWQSFGSVVLGIEAFSSYVPDVFIDTMGYPFTFFIFKYLAGCRVGCYVHYPTISTDMLSVVSDRTGSFNNRAVIANSKILTHMKLLYYQFFAKAYGYAGSLADVVMVNSSWTKGHIENLWNHNGKKAIVKVFPPCDIREFLKLPLERPSGNPRKTILSIGQFRPEKNHALQVKAFAHFLSSLGPGQREMYRLVMVGGCRNEGDESRVKSLKSLAASTGISDYVDIKVNIPFSELKQFLSTSHVGIHTMSNEHFGIGLVEFQAAGVVVLAHNSGGPKMDIVVNDKSGKRTGYLAHDVQSYSETLTEIFNLPRVEVHSTAIAARDSCERFSEDHFEQDFIDTTKCLMLS